MAPDLSPFILGLAPLFSASTGEDFLEVEGLGGGASFVFGLDGLEGGPGGGGRSPSRFWGLVSPDEKDLKETFCEEDKVFLEGEASL